MQGRLADRFGFTAEQGAGWQAQSYRHRHSHMQRNGSKWRTMFSSAAARASAASGLLCG